MIVPLIARVLQILLAAIVLALSIVLINGYGPGHNPSIIDYAAFCGGCALLISAIGIASLWFEALQGIAMLCLDAFAALFLVAGGIAFPTQIKVGSCANKTYTDEHYKIFWPSTSKLYGSATGSKYLQDWLNDVTMRCRLVQADTAFVWFTFGMFVVTLALTFLGTRGKTGGHSFV